MKPLRSALTVWSPAASQTPDPVSTLRAEWATIAGAEVAANTRPLEIAHGTLVVLTRSSAWSQQLAFLSERIIEAVRERTGVGVERVRFRVGRLSESAPANPRSQRHAGKRAPKPEPREPAPSLEAAFARFREDVTAAQRAKARAGWKECSRCGVRIFPTAGSLCTPCANTRADERTAAVARLLFEVPWLGYAGIAPLVERLTPQEYQAIRRRLLSHWWDALTRVRRTGGKALTTRDRMIASSYVLLKSELDPEQIAPAAVRDLLGDELHEIFYGNENN